MDYKKYIFSQKMRIGILKLFWWVPDSIMLRVQYFIKFNRKLNLANPKRYSEKIQHYKLYYKNPMIKICTDKYEVRGYIKSLGLESYLNKLYGLYNSIDEVNIEELPDKFVVKTTDGGGGLRVFICNDINKIDKDILYKTFKLPKKSYKNIAREWPYQRIKRRIIVEELLEDLANPKGIVNDYKFFCFEGIVKYVVVDNSRFTNHRRNFYDKQWRLLNIKSDHDQIEREIPVPVKFQEMIAVAEKLSSPFPFVRVDLYNINGLIRFGEMTFYPWSGYIQFEPDSFDFELGQQFNTNYNNKR